MPSKTKTEDKEQFVVEEKKVKNDTVRVEIDEALQAKETKMKTQKKKEDIVRYRKKNLSRTRVGYTLPFID